MKQQEERDREARIREKAYHLWEAEGRPEGREGVHWDQATELIAIEDNQRLATTPLKASMENIGPTGEPVEPLLAVQNIGEVPTLTDQGEEVPFPQPPQPDRTAGTGRTVGTDRMTGDLAATRGSKPSRGKSDKRDASAAPMRQAAAKAVDTGRGSIGTTGPASKPTAKAAAKTANPKSQPASGTAGKTTGKSGKGATGRTR